MDLDTLKLVAEILPGVYLVLLAYNVYCGYRLFTDTETYDGSILAPLIGREPGKLTCLCYAVILGLTLPETRTQLWMLRYRFFPPKPPRDEDVPLLDRRTGQ